MDYLERMALIAEYRACVEHYKNLARRAAEGRTLWSVISMESARRHCERARAAIDKQRAGSVRERT
jgi:hypothetical protein